MLNHQSVDSYSCQCCDIMKNAFECALCSFLCDSETVFRTHLNAEHKSNFLPCVYCETLYNAPHFLLRHMKATHSLDAKVYRCGNVGCTFKTTVLKKFLSHLDLCTVGKAVKCYHCKSTFSSSNLLILHMQGKLKILLNKAYPVDKIIRIVPSPAPQPVFQTYSSIREPKSSIFGNLDKTGKTNILPADTVTDQSTPHMPIPVASLSSKKLSYILPKSVVVKPVEKTLQTYSSVTPLVAAQEISVSKNISHNVNNPHVLRGAVVLHNPSHTGKLNTLISDGSLKNSVLDVSSSGKLSSISVCQISSTGVTSVEQSKVSELINKTATVTTKVSPSTSKLENELPKTDTSDDTRKGPKLVILPIVRVDTTKNISVMNTIPSNKTHCVVLPKSPSIVSETDLSVSAGQNFSNCPTWPKYAFNKNICSIAPPKHCVKIPSKIMLIPVPPPPSVHTVLQPEFSRNDACTHAPFIAHTSRAGNIASSAKPNPMKVIQSLCTGSVSQVSSRSGVSCPPSSTLHELDTVSKHNFRLNVLHEPSSKVSSLSSSDHANCFSVELKALVDKSSHKTGPAADAGKVTFSSPDCTSFCASETLTCDSCNVTSNSFVLSSVACHCQRADNTFKSPVPSLTSPLAPVTGSETEVPEPGAKFSPEGEFIDHVELSSLEKTVISGNMLSLKPGGLINKLPSSSSEGHCDTHNYSDGVAIVTSCCTVHSERKGSSTSDGLTSAAKQNSCVTAISEASSVASETPVVSPVTPIKKEELTSLPSFTNKTSTVCTSSTFVTYVKQKVISSCDVQFETAVPGLTAKSKIALHEKIHDKFNDYYGDIAAVVSSHSLLSQKDNNATVSHNLISTSQDFHRTTVSESDSVSISTPVFASAFTVIKEEPPFSYTDISEMSAISTSPTLVTSIKEEVMSACDLQYKTPPVSPIIGQSDEPTNYSFSNSICVKSEISSDDDDFETVSSAVHEELLSPSEKNSDIEVIQPVLTSGEIYSSHSRALTSSPSSCVPDAHKEKNAALLCQNTNDSEFTCTSTVPVSSHCIKSVTAFSSSPLSGISQILSDAYSVSAVYTDTNSFKSVTPCVLSRSAGSVNRDAVCDVTFTTLAIKPEISSNSGFSRDVLPSVMNTNGENSTCELPTCASVQSCSEALTGSEVCGISSVQHSAKIVPNYVPLKLIIATSTIGCTARKSPYRGDFNTVVSSGSNEKTCYASYVSQSSTTTSTSICDSQHMSFKHSIVDASFGEIILKRQSISAAAYDHQSSHPHIGTLENNIPHLNLCEVPYAGLSTPPTLPETAENQSIQCRTESTMSCNEYNECKSFSCDTSTSSSPDDRHPFLNSTNMTVRQILEKFRGKCKSNINASRKSSLRTTSQTRKNLKDLNKRHIQCSDPLVSSASTVCTPSANKTVLKEVSQPPPDTGLQTGDNISSKRKASQVLEMDIAVESPTLKVQKVDEHVISLLDHPGKHPAVHLHDECSIKSEILPSCVNEQSISANAQFLDQYCFSQLENEVLSDSHSTENMCSATDILQVARELLSYNETPGDELTDILQDLKRRKSGKALKQMLQPLKLKDFFKCMARHCSYTSNFCVKFSKHLKEHDTSLCTCAYCLVDFPARDNLICHLMQEHKRSLFQCSLCFYRASSQTHVCVHFRNFHSCEKGHIITCSPVDNHPVSTFKENYMVCYSNIAKPYNCCFCDCSFSCIAILDIIHHILYHHPISSSYTCMECQNDSSDIFEWLIHCQLHGIHLFHCIHCAFGAETRTDMLYHISTYHANENLVVFVRSSRYLMLHLEHFLKYSKQAKVKNLCDISNDFPFVIKEDQLAVEVQVILENTTNVERSLKCLYCLCSTEYASEMQNHLYSKHSQNDFLYYFFCQSQFQTISEAEFIFGNLNSCSSNEQCATRTDMILSGRNSLTIDQPTVPLQILFVETPSGVVNLQLPVAVFKQHNFRGKYVRIFKSLHNQMESKIHGKRFKCLYCQKTERYLYKLRQHWRCCHVQTGKKFKYDLINKKKHKVTGSLYETRPSVITNCMQHLHSKSALCVQNCSTCQFCIYSHKTSENGNSNWDALGVWGQIHHSQCDSSLKIMDSFSLHEKSDNGGPWGHHSLCYNSCNFLQSTEVPSEEECFFRKCNCLCNVRSHTICRMFKQCCAESTGNQICTYDKNKVQQLKNKCTGMFKSYRLVASCSCLMKCSEKARCFKKHKSGETDKCSTLINYVKLKVFLRKLPYSIKLPVLYLKQIINFDPVVVLSDMKYQHKIK